MLKNLLVPGAFDLLHEGHKYLFSKASEQAENLRVVIVTPSRRERGGNYHLPVESAKVRAAKVHAFLNSISQPHEIEILNPSTQHDILAESKLKYLPDTDGICSSIEAPRKWQGTIDDFNMWRETQNLPPIKWIIIPLKFDKYGLSHSSSRRRFPQRDGALQIKQLPGNQLQIIHNRRKFAWDIKYIKKLTRYYLRKANEGDVPGETEIVENDEIFAHRRELYAYIVDNNLFEIKFPRFKTFETTDINKIVVEP